MTAADKAEHAPMDDPESLVLARAELHRLADAWRSLLTMHERDKDGRCQACPGMLRRRRWPCHIWLTAQRHLVDDLPRRARRRHPLRWRVSTRHPLRP